MMSTRARRGVAVAGGLAAILAAVWYWNADRTLAPTLSPVPVRVELPAAQTPSLTLWPESPTYFNYELLAWRNLLPAPVVAAVPVPRVAPGAAARDGGSEQAPEGRDEQADMDPWIRSSEVMSDWVQVDRSRGYRGPWHHFLENWVDPLVVESDGVGFYDPSEYPVNSVLPVKLPKAYGFGVKFKASF